VSPPLVVQVLIKDLALSKEVTERVPDKAIANLVDLLAKTQVVQAEDLVARIKNPEENNHLTNKDLLEGTRMSLEIKSWKLLKIWLMNFNPQTKLDIWWL